ncbi:MAG: DUF11 domain-containing protein [Candidatus Marinimicrobia bacterium]|nr:DUF11 domain-containing protein [Candidatus Neomarinimicrobiota bacterium]
MRRLLALISLMGAVVFGQVPVGTEIINVAQSSHQDGSGTTFVGSSNEVITIVSEGYQLAISKTASAAVVAPGESLTYTITVTNTGNISPAPFTITDTLSSGLDITSSTPEASVSNQVAVWNVASIAGGQTLVFELEVLVDENLLADEVISNTAWLAVSDGFLLASESADVNIGAHSDLLITKMVAEDVSAIGDTVHYSINVYNTGNIPSTETVINDVLPEHVSFVSASHSGVIVDSTVSWNVGEMMSGDSVNVSLDVIVDATMPANADLTNHASVENAEGVSKEASVHSFANPWIQTISKWAADQEYAFGDTVEFTITIDNTSPDPVHAISVHDTLPEPLEFVSASNGGSFENGAVDWTLGTLNAGNVITLNVVTTVGSLLEARPEITNRAWISTANAGTSWGDHVVSLAAFPELVLEKRSSATVQAGDSLVYTFIMRNTGNSMAHDVALIDTLPAHVSFGSTSGDFTYDEASHSILWNVNEIASSATDSLVMVTYVDYPVVDGTTLENTAHLSCVEGSVSQSTSITEILSAPGLFLDMSGTSTVVAGDTLQLRLDYRNLGTETATGVVLTDTLGTDLEYLNASREHTYDPETGIITWNLDDLTPGDNGVIDITAKVPDDFSGTAVIPVGGLLSCDQGAQSVDIHVVIVRAPIMDIVLVGDTSLIEAGEFITYDLSFENYGDTTAVNVVVVDSLPADVDFLGASNDGVYDSTSHSVTWYVGDLDPVEPAGVAKKFSAASSNESSLLATRSEPANEFTIDVRVIYPLPNGMELPNTAYIYVDGVLQATATWLAIVQAAPEFVFTKTADLEVFPGDTINYQIDVANWGTDHASGVSILDTLDSRVTFLGATGDYIYDVASHSLQWFIGPLNVEQAESFEITTTVDDMLGHGEQVGNRAWLVSNESDAIPAVALTTNILPLSIVVDAQPRTILGNGAATSTLSAHVYSFLGNPVPDGVDVNFYTDLGTIPDSVAITSTVDGVAYSTLVADTVTFESVTATPYGRAIFAPTQWADDTTQVTFIIGAFDGAIYNYEGLPQEDVRVELRCVDTGAYAGHDSTDANGYYLIPIYKDDLYQIIYTLIGDNGVPYETVQEIEINTPSEGSLVTNLNSVSGFLYDEITNEIIAEDSILVIVNGEVIDSTSTLPKTSDHHMTDSTYTDSTGKYFFTNLLPGTYSLTVVYNGISSYSDGGLDVNLTTPGLYVVNANVTLRSSPFYILKTVDKLEAAVGDTLHYRLDFGTQDITFIDSVFVTDYLPNGLELIANTVVTDANTSYDGLDLITNEMSFSRSDIQLGDSLHIDFDAKITIDAGLGWIENKALVASTIDSTWSDRNINSRAKTKIIFPFLKVTKQSNRRVIEIGDVVTYTVKMTNTSADDIIHDFVVEDVLPYGFKFRKNTSYLNGSKIGDPNLQEAVGKRLAMTWTIGDTLQPGDTFTMKYRIIAGMNSREGTNTNEVMARAHTLLGFPVISNLATADVVVKPGLFSDRGLIIGKVYYDTNANGIHDENEETVKDVELIMENGARIITDEYGKYSVPDVEAGMHVIRVNERTLPALSEIILDSPDYLGDTQSKMVRVAAASIAKSNFALREISVPGKLTGTAFYDVNRNGIFDPDEEVQSDLVMVLNDSKATMTDSLGRFTFKKAALGDLTLRVDDSSLPSYGRLFSIDSTVDSLGLAANRWNATLYSGDSININIPLEKLELFSVLSKESTLEMKTEMLTEEFRLLVYKPWSLLVRIGFVSGSATLQSEIFNELRNIGDLMKWQTQINLDIKGHTDHLPVAPGSGFRDNQELSESRALAIRTYLVQTMGISESRITAVGMGASEPMQDGNTPEGRSLNRRVEMVFFNAAEEDSKFNQLEFMYDINYTGEIPIRSVRFHQELPPGFIYKPGTAILDSTLLDPIVNSEERDIWSFGDWDAKKHTEFDVAMKPDDYELVQNTGVVAAHLELIDEDGNLIVTDTLETRISTLVETLSFNMILEGTQFDVGSADLKPSAEPSLRKLGDFLSWQPDIEIVIEGFTDDRGSLEFNMLLSDWRAISVKNFLIENYNLNPENIHTHGLGPHYPIGDNETWIGRATNRRVEVLVNAELGEAALLELDVIKESLLQKIVIPVNAFESMSPDSALSIPANQSSTLLLNMSYPAYATADSIAITLALPTDLEYVDVAGTFKTWGQTLEAGGLEVVSPIQINAPEGVVGVRELFMNVQLFNEGQALSSHIEKVLRVNLQESESGNE